MIKLLSAAFLMMGFLLLQGGVATAAAGIDNSEPAQLKFVIILSRHGVRSPTGSPEKLNPYSAKRWPQWDVPPGYLTQRGAQLMTVFGKYYRDYFVRQGLLRTGGCSDATSVAFIADSDQRTVATGEALAAGMFPDCSIKIRALPQGTPDALFHSVVAGIGNPNHMLAAAAVSGRIGDDPNGLTQAYASTLQDMETILSDCRSSAHCTQPKQSLLQSGSSISPGKRKNPVDFRGPLATGSTVAEDFLLEFANGMPLSEVGWGRVDGTKINEMIALHTAHADLLQRTPYLAQVQASNLVSHILSTLQQAIEQKKVVGALGEPGDTAILLVGHDTNIASVAGLLGISWLIDGRRDDTPPGGALVFEVWRSPVTSEYTVRTYYVSQTLEQMRSLSPLTLDQPPARANIFVPGCSTADREYSCKWGEFARTVKKPIDRAFVQ